MFFKKENKRKIGNCPIISSFGYKLNLNGILRLERTDIADMINNYSMRETIFRPKPKSTYGDV